MRPGTALRADAHLNEKLPQCPRFGVLVLRALLDLRSSQDAALTLPLPRVALPGHLGEPRQYVIVIGRRSKSVA